MQITSWASKRVLITGSGGFIGSHLLTYFKKRHAKVLGIIRAKKISNHEISIDLADKDKVFNAVNTFKPDAVFHLASEALVETGQLHPYETFHNNIVSTLNILEAGRILRVPRIIIASTVHVYGRAPMPYTEDEPARPSRPYETSKTSADLIAQSYADNYDLPVLIPRFVNIYGPGDANLARIIPKTMQSVVHNEQPVLWGGGAKRDYLYIDDALRAYDLLGKISDRQIDRNRIYNFATGKPVTAKKLMETIISLSGTSNSVKRLAEGRPHELERQEVNWSKAKRLLGWSPEVELVEGLSRTLQWFRQLRS